MKHELKIHPKFYCRVADGSKTFEIRNDDRGYQPGDTVLLKEWDDNPINKTSNEPKGFTDSPQIEATIGYIHMLDSISVVFSLLKVKVLKTKS